MEDNEIKNSPVRGAYFVQMSDELRLELKSFLKNPGPLEIVEDEPSIISLQDTVDLIEKKYGKCWRYWPECKCTVIWASRLFNPSHVQEVVPDLADLCREYKAKGTVNGHKFAHNFSVLAFSVVDPNYPIRDL